MRNIIVSLPDIKNQTYHIIVGENFLENIQEIIDLGSYSQCAIITDGNTNNHLDKLQKGLSLSHCVIEIPSGEKNKSIEIVETIWKKMIEAKLDRQSLIINLGGGVIGDMGGFAASTYMRGIDFINVPTTLLSQVDASVGGKTGIDFAGLKNHIGTFQQPKAVVIDIQTLKTLPKREFLSGFAEIIKHGLIRDEKYYKLVTSKRPENFSQVELIEIISRSCEIKKEVVQEDPKENGLRKILNLGHTIGHAIEALSLETNTPLLHGEAISLGMLAEAKLSELNGHIKQNDLELIKNNLENAGLPTKTTLAEVDKIIGKIESDKKSTSGIIKWTLLKKIGKAIYDQDLSKTQVIEAIKYIKI